MTFEQYFVGCLLIGGTVGALLGGTDLAWQLIVVGWVATVATWSILFTRYRR